MKKFIRLKELSTVFGAAMLCMLGIVSDLDAVVYGKLNGGNSIGYKETLARANGGDTEAQAKIDEVNEFVGIINRRVPDPFESKPNHMSVEEFMFEALNAPEDQIDSTVQMRIPDAVKRYLRYLERNNKQANEASDDIMMLNSRLSITARSLASAKSNTDKAVKKTLQAILTEIARFEIEMATDIRRLVDEINEIQEDNSNSRDAVTRFQAKVEKLDECSRDLDRHINAFRIDFDQIFMEKRREVHAATEADRATYGRRHARAPLIDVNMMDADSNTKRSIEAYQERVREFAGVLRLCMRVLFTEMRRMVEMHMISDDELEKLALQLAKLCKLYEGNANSRALAALTSSGFFAMLVLRDINFHKRLYDAMADNIKTDPGTADRELTNRSIVPNPDDGSWYMIAVKKSFGLLPDSLRARIGHIDGFIADDEYNQIDERWIDEHREAIIDAIKAFNQARGIPFSDTHRE